jgi:hypothetical protein
LIDGNPRPPNNKRRSIFSKPPHLCTDNWQPFFRRQHYALLLCITWAPTLDLHHSKHHIFTNKVILMILALSSLWIGPIVPELQCFSFRFEHISICYSPFVVAGNSVKTCIQVSAWGPSELQI